jgi:hypothetical protein
MPHLLSRIVAPTAFAACCFLVVSAHAAAPMVKTQAPGYYRVMLGDFELTALADGTLALPGDHVGGLMNGDKLVFPDATVRADKHDADDWISQANMEHLAFPGLGHLRCEGSGYLWIPANYASLR